LDTNTVAIGGSGTLSAAVFISHSSRDQSVAVALCLALEQRGIGCWLASRDIGPGENFQEAIVRAVQQARVMLLVFTASANDSDEIKKELALASQNRVLVIPVRTEDVLPGDAFRYELATRQWVDLFQDWENGVSRLAEHVRSAVGDGTPLPPPPPVHLPPERGIGRMRVVVVAGAAAALAAAGGFWLIERQLAPPPIVTVAPPVKITGPWVSELLTSPYASNEKYMLQAEFEQHGEALSGTIKEIDESGRGSASPIREGHVSNGQISFYTVGQFTTGDDTSNYRETYQGVVQDKLLDFTRQNDTPSGGETEHFTLHRK
jgi:hypothetical protein